jgi:hypothetical protein
MLSSIKLLFFISITAIACQEMDEFKALKEAKEITLHRLIAKDDTASATRVIADRQVENSLVLTGKNRDQLLRALRKKENYQSVSRRCLMAPLYALEADGKIIALFDPQFCPRIQYLGGDKESELDIVAENSILEALEAIYKNQD